MHWQTKILQTTIHRHTGGLEIFTNVLMRCCDIHRHTGGLEMLSCQYICHLAIHRHTGGLEILVAAL